MVRWPRPTGCFILHLTFPIASNPIFYERRTAPRSPTIILYYLFFIHSNSLLQLLTSNFSFSLFPKKFSPFSSFCSNPKNSSWHRMWNLLESILLSIHKCNDGEKAISFQLQRAAGWCETVYVLDDYPLRAVHWIPWSWDARDIRCHRFSTVT